MSRLSSILKNTCPRCRKGKLFLPFTFKAPLAMHKSCSVCSQHFEPEPGFYYGAMFISYIFISFLSLSFVGLSVFYFHFPVDISFMVLVGMLALLFFWNLRLSRSIWIHLIVKYNPSATQKAG